MSKTVKERAEEFLLALEEATDNIPPGAWRERSAMLNAIERALVEHEKAVGARAYAHAARLVEAGGWTSPQDLAQTLWNCADRAHKPAGTEEPRLWFGVSSADVKAGRHTKGCYWNACHGAQVCTCEKEPKR